MAEYEALPEYAWNMQKLVNRYQGAGQLDDPAGAALSVSYNLTEFQDFISVNTLDGSGTLPGMKEIRGSLGSTAES